MSHLDSSRWRAVAVASTCRGQWRINIKMPRRDLSELQWPQMCRGQWNEARQATLDNRPM